MITKRKNLSRFLALVMCLVIAACTIPMPMTAVAAPTCYQQGDARWGGTYIGNWNIAESGCGILSTVNAVNYLTGNFINPIELGQWAHSKNYYNGSYGQGTVRWNFYPNVTAAYGAKYGFKITGCSGGGVTSSALINHLKAGGAAVVHVPNHFMAITGYNSSTGQYLVYDSAAAPKRNTSVYGSWLTAAQLNSNSLTVVDWYCLVSATGSSTVTPPPAATLYTVRALVSSGSGSVHFGDGITSASVAAGTVVNYQTTPASGYRVSKILVGGTAQTIKNNGADCVYQFTMPSGNVDVAVSFEPIAVTTYTATTQAGTGGVIHFGDGVTQVVVTEGTTFNYRVTPDAGYHLSSLTINGTAVAIQNKGYEWVYQITMPAQNTVIRADFSLDFSTNLGESFYARIYNSEYDRYVSIDGVGEPFADIMRPDQSQIWKFERMDENNAYKIINVKNGLVLDLQGGDATLGTNIITYQDVASDAQRWYLSPVNGGYVLRPKAAVDNALDIDTSSQQNIACWNNYAGVNQTFQIAIVSSVYELSAGEPANLGDVFYSHLYNAEYNKYVGLVGDEPTALEKSGDNSQLWKFEYISEDGSYKVTNVGNGKVLDLANEDPTPGTEIITYTDTGAWAQRWYIVPKNGGYILQCKAAKSNALDIDTGGQTGIACWDEYAGVNQIFQINSLSGIYTVKTQVNEGGVAHFGNGVTSTQVGVGTLVNYQVTPNEGYIVSSIKLNDTPVEIINNGGDAVYQFTSTAEETTVYVTFELDVPKVEVYSYRVQCGRFSVKENADNYCAKIKAAGFDAYLVQDGSEYVVNVGVFGIKANADAYAAQIKAAGFDAMIVEEVKQTAATITVSFNSQSDIVLTAFGGALADIPVPTKTHGTFKGYFSDQNGTGTQYYDAEGKALKHYDRESDITLYALWETRYTVNYYTQKLTGKTSVKDVANYDLAASDVITALAGAVVSPELNSYYGFNAPVKQTVTVTEDGATVISYFYMLKYGDIDNDNSVTADDLTLLKKQLLGCTEFKDRAGVVADINGDGVIDLKDLLRMKFYMVDSNVKVGS